LSSGKSATAVAEELGIYTISGKWCKHYPKLTQKKCRFRHKFGIRMLINMIFVV